jgi:hypothetical protein
LPARFFAVFLSRVWISYRPNLDCDPFTDLDRWIRLDGINHADSLKRVHCIIESHFVSFFAFRSLVTDRALQIVYFQDVFIHLPWRVDREWYFLTSLQKWFSKAYVV